MRKILLSSACAFALMAGPAYAGPISAAIAATVSSLFAGGGVASAVFSIGSFTLKGISAVVAQFAVRAALGYALNALTSKPQTVSRGYETNVNQIGPGLPHQIIYGETRVGGAVFYQATSSSNGTRQDRLHRCIAFAGHEINSYEKIYLDDVEVTLDSSGNVTAPVKYVGNVRIKQYLGTDTQSADPDLVSEIGEWTSDCTASGIAYLYVRFEDAANFQQGIPNVSVLIRGKKVVDPRVDPVARVWSDNPALCIRDYVLSDYGLNDNPDNTEETLFENAADSCEEVVLGGDKYTCNGSFLLDSSPEGIIRSLLSSMGGIFWNYSGKWAIQAAEYRAPTLSLSEDDLRSPLQVATRHSRRDNFNTVVGQYKGAETNYQPDNFGQVSSGLWVEEDNGKVHTTELNLLFTDTEVMAQRIANIFLRRNRSQITVSGAFGLRAMDLKVGDNVMLSVDHMNWINKVFEVVDWRLGVNELEIQVNMILREMGASVFEGIVDTLDDESGNALQDESGNELEAIVA